MKSWRDNGLGVIEYALIIILVLIILFTLYVLLRPAIENLIASALLTGNQQP